MRLAHRQTCLFLRTSHGFRSSLRVRHAVIGCFLCDRLQRDLIFFLAEIIVIGSDWKNLCNGHHWLPSNLHSWSSHCTGLLFAGKLPDLHSRVPTYDNQPQSGLVWSLKGTFFFHLLISSGVLVVPKNVSSSVGIEKALQRSEAVQKGRRTRLSLSTWMFKGDIVLLLNPQDV